MKPAKAIHDGKRKMMRRACLLVLMIPVLALCVACGVPVKHYGSLARGEIESLRFRSSYPGAVKNIPYVPDATDEQMLDIYKADGEGTHPVVVFIHGGSWKSGSRREYAALGETLHAEGFVTVLVDYRLYPGATYPAFMEDAAAALNWIDEHIVEYGGDPSRVIVSGHSAGAHIAALLMLHDKFRNLLRFDPGKIRGVVLLAGGYEFERGLSVPQELIRSVMVTPEDYTDAQPLRHVRADVPAMLVVNGDEDRITFEDQAARFAAAMRKAGADIRYQKIRGGDHFTVVLDMMPARRGLTYRLFLDFTRARARTAQSAN